jgi:hypothetical protein
MIGQIDPTAIAPYLAGPGAAVLVLLLVGAACYRLVVEHLVPMARTIAGRHLEQIDQMLEQQRRDSEATVSALRGIDARLQRLELVDRGLLRGVDERVRPDSLGG